MLTGRSVNGSRGVPELGHLLSIPRGPRVGKEPIPGLLGMPQRVRAERATKTRDAKSALGVRRPERATREAKPAHGVRHLKPTPAAFDFRHLQTEIAALPPMTASGAGGPSPSEAGKSLIGRMKASVARRPVQYRADELTPSSAGKRLRTRVVTAVRSGQFARNHQ